MARVRTVEFLPEIFQTTTNQQFLSATLDQLVQEPAFKKIQGFVGRRVGPGVNADDQYVAETTATRTNYQLEPGVILTNTDHQVVEDAITYPGLIDALNVQGAEVADNSRLFTSDYYSWDPFVDFDKLVNYGQYYWLPGGPETVDVYATAIPLEKSFTVTRENGVYNFSSITGNNPSLTLVRGGTYTFNVAQNEKETINFLVSNKGTQSFQIDYQSNPTLTLVRGNTYIFNLSLQGAYPFLIKTAETLGTTNLYNEGVTNNGATTGNIIFTVPQDAPDTLYYVNPSQYNMRGQFNIVDGQAGTGPGFWIQAAPGVEGKMPLTPNISSRDVYGVINNGEDLGTVTFEVPLSTAQSFYYSLTQVSPVDLVTNLDFNQINNQPLDTFLATYGGIDGITVLDGKTLIFQPTTTGWTATNLAGGYGDTFDEASSVTDPAIQYGIWQVVYVDIGGTTYITLNPAGTVNTLEKFSILYGTEYSTTQWYKNDLGDFEQIPLLTAVLNTLYYQDGTDPEIVGTINLVDEGDSSTLDVNEIIGRKNYTSPNGVVFTNGLKVQFTGSVTPSSYSDNSYFVEGVGTAIKLLPVSNFVTPETYTKSASVPYASTPYDIGNYDASLNQPLVPDYLTINRASPDLNAWTRSNRWFHVDVINASAAYNNTVPVLDNNFRAKRPILEYRAGTKLYDFGTEGKQPVDIIDFNVTDALSTINGTTGYSTDGYTFVNGSRVIFAADLDPQVRNKIYTVEFITPDSVPPLIAEPIINLVPAADGDVSVNQTVVVSSGLTQQGNSYYYDGVAWIAAQQKTKVNQAPLFDVYDANGISFSDRAYYPGSNFTGTKLFSYAVVNGATVDPILGFALQYLSLSNIGDIVFDNNFYTDQFTYTKENVSSTLNISEGFIRQYSNRVDYIRELGWQPAITKSVQRQQFRFNYDGSPLQLDVVVRQDLPVTGLQIYVGSEYQEPNSYTVAIRNDSTIITLNRTFALGSVIEVDAISDQTSKVGFYTVPLNLENNPLNVNSSSFTLGTIRTHYETIGENLKDISGPINGANNTRDLGNLIPYGTNIVQQSSPLTLAGYFMRSAQYNIFAALEFNSREYEKFKAQLLDTATRNDYTNYTIPEMLTAIISDINAGRTSINPFYWSDMLPASSIYKQRKITYTPITTNVFDLTTTYDFTSSNYKGLLVYVNDNLLTINKDYTVAVNGPRLTITSTLNVGDVITIQEYDTTYGSFVPNTPTKMGLYPAWEPIIYPDYTYINSTVENPTFVIQGHDGSKTIAFGTATNGIPVDFRDQLLLEFEKRIYNNLKIKSEIPLPVIEVMPGQFRTTDYTLSEINQILAPSFLSWTGWNKLNYQNQDFLSGGNKAEFTWNYSASGNLLSDVDDAMKEAPLNIGAWRGIYQYFYDTIDPARTPWEMLGFTVKPTWWEDQYGPVPYTRDNLVLWEDLAAGRVADPDGEYFLPQYARPGLINVIPTSSEGELVSPLNSVVGAYDPTQFQKSWVFGDGGPVEYTWRSSSSYPFALMRMLSLTRPAEFFALFADRDLYKYNTEFDQYLYNNRYRLDANGVEVYGNGLSKASYINWIVDYNRVSGLNSTDLLTADLSNLDVRLCYRLGSFTDKQYTRIYTEKSSPESLNSSLLLPDESYNLLLYKNQAFDQTNYSSVVVQVVDGGYAVFGYGMTQAYFNILASRAAGTKTIISAGGSTVSVPNQYSDNIVQVPYGYTFTNQATVVDFLLSYGKLLETQGFIFDTRENGKTLNWNQMAQEFLYWANQGWGVGSVINLNPTATSLTIERPGVLVDSVVGQTVENQILDQNRLTLPVRDLVVDRQGNRFTISSLSSQTISYLNVHFVNYETLIVLNNVSIFNDLIYNPATGARQNRVEVASNVSAEWNGQLDAQGFILNNQRTVKQWQPNTKYAKGEIVLYKNNYWSAQTIVQPAVEFRYTDWVKSDYTKIQGGLLENIPNKANQLANSYDTVTANLETDQDLLSYGLIGFRPREYLAALNLDDVSQVNVYKQFLKDKGTIRSVRLLGNANLGKEVAEYDLYENWAIQRGVYGANANRSFVELRLNESLLTSNPSTVQVVLPQEVSLANQPILLNDVWRESYKLSNTDIYPTTLSAFDVDTALPSAGYVNINDVDITVFSLLGDLSLAPGVLSTVGIGTTIWAAKSNTHDWNVYRCNAVPGRITSITSNLDTTSTVTFSTGHNLVADNIIIIRYISDAVDGVYRVLSAPSPSTITIELTTKKVYNGSRGLAYNLQSMRVAEASDVYDLPYANELVPGARAWVDNNGQGLWTVLEKTSPFNVDRSIEASILVPNSLFGSSISQGKNNIIALVGSPNYGSYGGVYSYIKDNENQYSQGAVLEVTATGTEGYGSCVKIGRENWAVAGASKSNNNQGYAATIYRASSTNAFIQNQLLVAPDQDFGTTEFGYAVTISEDEHWMFIGAPGGNKVYPYARYDIENQYIEYTTSSTQLLYSYLGYIDINEAYPEQLSVVLNNSILEYGLDYLLSSSAIVLTQAPVNGQKLIISRKQGKQLDRQTYFNVGQTSTSGSGTDAAFTVDNIRGVYTASLTAAGTGYAVSDTITIDGTTIGVDNSGPNLPTSPANDLTITITSVDGDGAIVDFTRSGSGITDNYVFPLDPYLYTATNIYSFTVIVNGKLMRPHLDYDFNTSSSDDYSIVFNTVPPSGADIEVSANTYWQPIEDSTGQIVTLEINGIPEGARFGASLSSSTDGRQVYIGAPFDDVTVGTTTYNTIGSTYVFDRSVTRYIINNTSTTTFALPSGYNDPVAVILNGTYLKNSSQYVNGQFSISGSDVVLNSTVTLNIGDTLEIETNIFNLIQKVNIEKPFDEAQFGACVVVCPDNDELYVGAPFDGNQLIGAGSVTSFENQARSYGVISSTIANPTLTAGDQLRINNMLVAVPASPNNTVAGLATAINTSGIPNVVASATNGIITISIINKAAGYEGAYIDILPGYIGTAFDDLGFELYQWTQTIVSPNPQPNAHFGQSIDMDTEYESMIIGAPRGDIYEPVTFDGGTTYFDDRSTIFSSTVVQSGAVYTYDYFESANGSITNPGHWVFGQQVWDQDVQPLDQWGTAVSYRSGRLLIGAPGSDLGDSSVNYGRVAQFDNPTLGPSWVPIHTQQPVVEVGLINSVYMYNKLQGSETHFFDFIDPLQGKILGAARQNIDYISTVDPAKYNTGTLNNNGNFWAAAYVGQMWWDISTVRFIDPNQDDIVYASRRWGQVFPGSVVQINQWIESSVPPSQYTGPGRAVDVNSYTVTSRLTEQGTFATLYYFWVTDIDTIYTTGGKTLSTNGVARYIESPSSSGIPFTAFLNASTVAIYNGSQYLSAADTIIHVDYDREYTDDNIHTEFELISQDVANSFISSNLYRKMQDSFCGVNETGAKVPDPFLSPAERYGVQFRPRQSMFVDRFQALKNYLTRANTILAQYPIVEVRSFNLLNSSEPEPTEASGEWNKRLLNIEQLGYQDLNAVPLGYKYLVASDSTNGGLWTIYTVLEGTALLGYPRYTELTRVQNYDTRKYWNHVNWYQPGYNSSIVPVAEVPVYAGLAAITLTQAPVGSSVKVTSNAQGKFEIYLRTDTGWERVGLEDGTIAFSESLWNYQFGSFGYDVEVFDAQYFDAEPVIETRKIIQAINEELFINELAIERNRNLILMFEFILSESTSPEWLTKTSLVDVIHRIRQLIPYQIYRQDNQDFVLNYIQEVKPYHVQIRQFNLSYDGQDSYPGMITDFDSPSFYDLGLPLPQYINPILLPYTKSTAVGTGTPTSIADKASDAEIWTLNPWKDWYNNYLLSVQDVEIYQGGTGYTSVPTVTITGDCTTPAELSAVINSSGQVVSIIVDEPGSGYSTTPTITITGGGGTGAKAYPLMGNELVRSFKTTIRYDRYQYTTSVQDWQANVTYNTGSLVRYLDQVWEPVATVSSETFDPTEWNLVDPSTYQYPGSPTGTGLTGVDRTMGYYNPTPDEPGLQLSLLINGIAYPGVQVAGVNFNQNTGYDVGNFDINPFDNIMYGPEGRPTYDLSILDTIYESYFGLPINDPVTGPIPTGTGYTDINVDGGAFVDTYESHAPEELVPGIEFDTLDMRVYTRPGADWNRNGHGFAQKSTKYVYDSTTLTYSFTGLEPDTAVIFVSNQTQGIDLYESIDYTIDWENYTVSFDNNVVDGDVVVLTAFELGGGNQLLQGAYNGADVGNSLTVPVKYSQIQEIAVFVNGVQTTDFTYASGVVINTTDISFTNTYTLTDNIAVFVLGPTTIDSTTVNYSWSTPVTEYLSGDGSTNLFNLTASLEYSNPINMIVTVDGVRQRTAAGVEWVGDESTLTYLMPDRLGVSQSLVADNEVLVFIDDVQLILGVDYFVDVWTGSPRTVTLVNPPVNGSRIVVSVTTDTDCRINSGELFFTTAPAAGTNIAVTTWNDTRQQGLLTKAYVGPGTSGNELYLDRVVTDPSRLWVSLNGAHLFYGDNFTVVNDEIILPGTTLSSGDVVMITMTTNSVVPEEMAFRIFQDMRGAQATYRITESTTTQLAQDFNTGDDIIYVVDASKLTQPDLVANSWGVITINGERILYRERNLVDNTVSSLLRGTAGTAAGEIMSPSGEITSGYPIVGTEFTHFAGTYVYDMSDGNMLPVEYQNYIDSNSALGDGTTTEFAAPDIDMGTDDSTIISEAVEVYVGGIRQSGNYSIVADNPVVVIFDEAPTSGYEVTILVRRGVTWYNPGFGTPSDGVALQDTQNNCARFLRGEI